MKKTNARMEDWLGRHFSDNVEAQKTIAKFASVLLAIGWIVFATAAFLSIRSGVHFHSARHDCGSGSVSPQPGAEH